jgi:DNA polymerase-3 subunit beta
MIGFDGAGRRLTTRLLGGEFLRYSSRFPAEFGSRAEVASAPLIEAVRRVSLVAERGSPVRLAFGDDEVVIEAGSQGQARAVERVPADFAGDERVIAFSPHYLLDGLTAAATPSPAPAGTGGSAEDEGTAARAPGPGRIRLEFTSAVRPAVITAVPGGPGDEGEADSGAGSSADAEGGMPDFRYLVVPLRMPGST